MNDAITWLCAYAFDRNINVTLDKLSFSTDVPSCMFGRSIIINTNWKNQNELPFIIAHEIGHVLNEDEGKLYYSTSTAHSKFETAANERAIDLLLEYCDHEDFLPNNYIDFMELYGIPRYVEEKVKKCFMRVQLEMYSEY